MSGLDIAALIVGAVLIFLLGFLHGYFHGYETYRKMVHGEDE